jgi:putative SOS response-associated peptidase YedK
MAQETRDWPAASYNRPMCGRYAFSHTMADLQALFQVANADDLAAAPRYNIAPTQLVPVVFRDPEGTRTAGWARWGLVPHWVGEPSEWRAATFNARSEEVAAKPAFRQAFKRGRVLVPASGFYEWRREGGAKTPYHIRRRDGSPLAFAGLMDVWRDRESDERLVSCAILTTASRGPLLELHDRMPVMVQPDDFEPWLASDRPAEALEHLLAADVTADLEVYRVSALVNSTKNDQADFTLPVGSF